MPFDICFSVCWSALCCALGTTGTLNTSTCGTFAAATFSGAGPSMLAVPDGRLSLSWEENVSVPFPNSSKLMEKMSKEIARKDFNVVVQIMRSKYKRKDILMWAFNSQKFLVLLCSKISKQLNLLQSYYLCFWGFFLSRLNSSICITTSKSQLRFPNCKFLLAL